MRQSRVLTQAVIVASFLLSTFAAHAQLDLSEGTMTTGGVAAFTIGNPPVGVPFNSISGSNIGLAVNVNFGYFIVNNLSLDVNLLAATTFSSPANAGVGLGLGARYFFDLGSAITPYIGLLPGILWTNGGVSGNSVWSLRLPVSAGILVALNSHVALDLGASAGFGWNLTNGGGTLFDLTIGYVGVKAFF